MNLSWSFFSNARRVNIDMVSIASVYVVYRMLTEQTSIKWQCKFVFKTSRHIWDLVHLKYSDLQILYYIGRSSTLLNSHFTLDWWWQSRIITTCIFDRSWKLISMFINYNWIKIKMFWNSIYTKEVQGLTPAYKWHSSIFDLYNINKSHWFSQI